MSRKTARELVLHMIFEVNFTGDDTAAVLERRLDPEQFQSLKAEDKLFEEYPDARDREYIERMMRGIDQHYSELDTYIERYSVGWKFGRISGVVSSILRLSMFEILYMQDIPTSVSINEAVELAKRYDTQQAAQFINGILGTFARKEAID